MNENPYPEGKEQAAEYLRLTLALLGRNGIPASPLNYRMGYDCIAGHNDALTRVLEDMPAEPGRLLIQSLWSVYQRTYVHESETLDTIRGGLMDIITGMRRDLTCSGGKLSGYLEKLNRFSTLLTGLSLPTRQEIDDVIEATRDTERSQRRINAQISRLSTDLETLRKELTQVRQESLMDYLTGISNRKAFDMALEGRIHAARKEESVFSILIADIDHFKQVNDSYGHLIGDKVLRFVASTLKRCIKGRDLAARFGGEEFAILLDGTDLPGAYRVAEQIRKAVLEGTIKDLNDQRVLDRISISLGIAQFDAKDLASDLLRRADEALYLAKARGRNRVETLEPAG